MHLLLVAKHVDDALVRARPEGRLRRSRLEHWHQTFGANNFPFHDLTAIIKKDWIVNFCKELYSRPFQAAGRPQHVAWACSRPDGGVASTAPDLAALQANQDYATDDRFDAAGVQRLIDSFRRDD